MYFLVLVNWKRRAFKRIFSSKIIFYINFYLLLINILLVPCLKLQKYWIMILSSLMMLTWKNLCFTEKIH